MAGVRQCWASTGLLQAWERSVQVEAAGKLAQLFPNMFPKEQFDAADPRFNPFPASTAHDESGTEDEQAGYVGVPFTEVEDEEEWVGWVTWDEVAARTDGAGSSAAAGSSFLVGYGDLVRHSAWCILYRCILGILYYTVLHIVCVNA